MIACHSPRRWMLKPTLIAAVCWVATGVGAQDVAEVRTVGTLHLKAAFPLEGIADSLDDLRLLQGEISRILQLRPANEPAHVYLFHNRSSYQAYLKRHLPTIPFRRAMFIKDTGPGMVLAYRHPDLDEDLRHEATHALLHASLDMLPIWIDEGLAEYFEVPSGQRHYDNPHLGPVRVNAWLGYVPSLSRLEAKRDLSELGRTDYRNCWSWVHFMIHGPPEAKGELIGYLQDIQRGAHPGKLSERLQRQVPDLRRSYLNHFKSWRRSMTMSKWTRRD